MNYETPCFTKTLFFAACLAVGCTGSGVAGCGNGDDGPTVDSELLGIYEISSYQSDEDGCESPMDSPPPGSFLALYSFAPEDDPEDPRLLGRFCGSVDDCRQDIREFPQFVAPGFAFMGGNDSSGWRGFAVVQRGNLNDMCLYEMQEHVLTSAGTESVQVDTRTFQFEFAPVVNGNDAECRDENAINELSEALARPTDQPPCTGRFTLEASHEADL